MSGKVFTISLGSIGSGEVTTTLTVSGLTLDGVRTHLAHEQD